MKTFFFRLNAYRYLIIGIWIFALLFFTASIIHKLFMSEKSLIDNSVGVWFDQQDPELIHYKNYNSIFDEREWTMLLVETNDIYSSNFLGDLKELTLQLERLDHVIKVSSLTSVKDNKIDEDGLLDYQTLFNDLVLSNAEALEQFKSAVKRNSIFEKNIVINGNNHHTVILIQNDNFIDDQSSYRIQLIDNIHNIMMDYPSIKNYSLAGTTVVNAELNRAALNDVMVFYSLVTLLLTLAGYTMLKHWRNLMVMYVVIATSVLPAMGSIALFGIAYNMVTVMLPTILIALSVAGVIHIITEFHQLRAKHSAVDSIDIALKQLFKPMLWTSISTVIGFLAFSFSGVAPIFQLGMFAALGLLCAFLANITLVPLLLVALWKDTQPVLAISSQKASTFLTKLQKYPILVMLFTFVLFLPLSGLLQLRVDTNYLKFFSGSHRTTQAYERVKQAGFAQNPIVIQLQYTNGSSFSDTDKLKALLEFEQALLTLPQPIKLLTPTDLLEEINAAFNDENARTLSEYTQAQIEQLLLLAELSGNDDLSDLLRNGGENIQLLVMSDYMSSQEFIAFKAEVYELYQRYLPREIQLHITGTTTLWANMDVEVSQTQWSSLLVMLFFLLFFLPVIFKSYRLGLLALAINSIPLTLTLGLMSWLEIDINIATALIGGISLGIVVDDTIHFISRLTLYRQQGMKMLEAVEATLATIGQSIIKTTVILVLGFSCMATSQFLPSAHFGVFISLSIALALYLDLVFLPCVLRLSTLNLRSSFKPVRQQMVD